MVNFQETELDLLPFGIFKTDKDRNILYANRYALDFVSCESKDRILRTSLNEFVSKASLIFLDSYVYPMLLTEGKADEVQLAFKSISGEKKPIVANVTLRLDGTTYWTFMSCINRDMLYNELLDARDTLQTQAFDLGKLNARIQERQADLQTFCHSLSHDFTGPLRRISQFIGFALDDLRLKGFEAPEEFKMLANARTSSETLLELTSGLVEFLVADMAVARNEELDLREIVSTVIDIIEEQDSVASKVHFKTSPSIYGNKAQVQVLFKNLIENAIKYNENDPEIIISHTDDVVKNRVLISIKDNGIGISEVYLEKIFEPFSRLNTAGQYRGNGLGLSIVKKLVLNNEGDIRVESELGSGSTFCVSLPLHRS